MAKPVTRPPFIISTSDLPEEPDRYPETEEILSYDRAIGRTAELVRLGLHVLRLQPGHRASWPHAEEKEEEFVYVLDGDVDAWIDGVLYPMTVGDLAAFPAGTGICHTFINNANQDAKLLVGGETNKSDNRIFYPLHPHRQRQRPPGTWWDDIPLRPQGDHDGLPDAQRTTCK